MINNKVFYSNPLHVRGRNYMKADTPLIGLISGTSGKGKLLLKSFFVLFFLIVLISPMVWGYSLVPGTETTYQVPDKRYDLSSDLSVQSFKRWVRYPAETQSWVSMINSTAYFRDVLVGGNTYIGGALDGDTWHATAITPDGLLLSWGTIRFYSSYNGNQNCFVSSSWVVCNTTSIYVTWYTNSQCRATGDWEMNFYNNGNVFYSGQFTVLPEIPPDRVPQPSNQGSYSDAYDSICHTGTQKNVYPCDGSPNEFHWTIANKGCALTSATMVLDYHGVNVDPPTLNTWLINNQGYNLMGDIYWRAVSRYASSVGSTVSFRGTQGNLENSICYYGPQIIGVKGNCHWVLSTGRDSARTTYNINDPNGGVQTTLAAKYNNTYGNIRIYSGPEFNYTDMTGIVIHFHSPGDILVTGPQGRMTGLDPISGIFYQEIPDSHYETIGLEDADTGDPGPETKEIDIQRPLEGEYTLKVIGTGEGAYALEIRTYDLEVTPSSAVFTGIPIFPGVTHDYFFYYSKEVGSPLNVCGNFDGKGQRPRDVNKFLTYSNPTQSQTVLPAGSNTYSMMIFYANSVIPGTFNAVLNRQDVTSLFNPVPGTNEVLTLNLNMGRNVLKLSIDGNLPGGRIATDTDRLVFIIK
jgi:hypothetical protein